MFGRGDGLIGGLRSRNCRNSGRTCKLKDGMVPETAQGAQSSGPGGSRVVKRRTPIFLVNDEIRGVRASEKRREQMQERSGRVMRDERSFISSAGAGGFLLAFLELRTTLVSF